MLSLRDLSIHGNTYIFRRDLHISERIFWIILIFASLTFSLYISLGEWDKFRNNPTALFIETDYRHFNFEKPGMTVCPIGNKDTIIVDILMKNFSLTNSTTPEYQYFHDYLKLIANTNYTNLEMYKTFSNDTVIKKEDYVKIATEIQDHSHLQEKSLLPMRLILTELGVCFTTSRIDKVMDPLKGQRPREIYNEPACRAGATCKLVFEPHVEDKRYQHFYVHSKDDVPSLDVKIKGLIAPGNVTNVNIGVNEMKSADNVRYLYLDSRKCRFADEPEERSYYGMYTVNLCAVNCRIRNSLKYCKCVPFFYMIKSAPLCSATGMVCLSNHPQWIETPHCHCPDTCTSITYQEHAVGGGIMHFFNFDTQINIILNCPKTRIVRKVIYSFMDFLVSFGGAVALFLGFSFVICLEFIFIILQNTVAIIGRVFRRIKENLKQKTFEPQRNFTWKDNAWEEIFD